MVKVFVYGTLKKGFSANDMLEGELVEADVVVKGYKMFSNGSFPMIVKGDKKHSVTGEVWSIKDSKLQELDWYEGYNSTDPNSKYNLYTREFLFDGVQGYVYNRELSGLQPIESGVFEQKNSSWY